ncbi:MAG TPA: hypothetical protein P5186_19885 [Candidatus Paceibacterota bacterium]|nr:hypothetical protein [Candidatus Paceibacterota bacterium]
MTAVAGAAAVAKRAITEYAGAESQMAKLDAALARNSQLTDEYRNRLQALAGDMQSATAIADDQWLEVLTRLTQFGADESNISQYADAVKHLAGIMDGDIVGAAHAFSRAMQGNFEAFSRYGIKIDETGTQTEKLARLMQDLAQRGGGQLEARAQSLAGQFGQLKNNFSDFLEAIGRGIAQTGLLQSVMGGVSVFFEAWAEKLGGPIERLNGLSNAVVRVTSGMQDSKSAAEEFKAELQSIKESAAGATQQLDRMVADIQKIKGHEDTLADRRKEYELAQVDKAEARGMPPVEAARARLNIENRYAQEKLKRQQEADRQTAEAERSIMAEAVAKEKKLQNELVSKRKQYDELGPVEVQKNRQAYLDAEYKNAKLERDQAINDLQKPDPLISAFSAGLVNVPTEANKQKLEEAEQKVMQLETALKRQSARTPVVEKGRAELGKEIEQIEQLLKSQVDENRRLYERNRDRQQERALDISYRQKEDQLDAQTRETRFSARVSRDELAGEKRVGGPVGGYVSQDAPLASVSPAYNFGAAPLGGGVGQPVPDQSGRMRDELDRVVKPYRQQLEEVGGYSAAAIGQLGNVMENQFTKLASSIDAVSRKLGQLETRMQGLRIP